MKILLYFLIYSCVVLSLFSAFVYLMTVVDPGLLDLPERAAMMMRTHVDFKKGTILPPEEYMDLSELLRNKTR